jgi:hypothetical protein
MYLISTSIVQAHYTWDAEAGFTEADFWEAYEIMLGKRYRDWVYKMKMAWLGKGKRPDRWDNGVWAQWVNHWESDTTKEISTTAKKNRRGTSGLAPSHAAGTANFMTTYERLVRIIY